jgi:hypothetical protein
MNGENGVVPRRTSLNCANLPPGRPAAEALDAILGQSFFGRSVQYVGGRDEKSLGRVGPITREVAGYENVVDVGRFIVAFGLLGGKSATKPNGEALAVMTNGYEGHHG